MAVLGEGLVVLGDLVTLGRVGVEIVLPCENRLWIDPAIEREAGLNGQLYRLAAEHRQGSGQSQANRANIRVGRRAETGGAAAENLGVRSELDVHLKPDDDLIFGDDLSVEARRLGRKRKRWKPFGLIIPAGRSDPPAIAFNA